MEIKENGIVSLDHKSCASITVQCLVDSSVTDWRTAFNMQINHAIKLGQMPDDIKVMRETLKAFGFVMQSTQVEDIRVQELLNKLGRLGRSALLFIQVVDYKHLGGNMIALGTDGFKYTLISPTLQKLDAIAHYRTAHVWIRWNDGVDRSPYPRRSVRRKNSVASHCRSMKKPNAINRSNPILATTILETALFVQYQEPWTFPGLMPLICYHQQMRRRLTPERYIPKF